MATPWEERPRPSPARAFFRTVMLFFQAPDRAWSETSERGGFLDPVLYAVVIRVLVGLVSLAYLAAALPFVMALLPPELSPESVLRRFHPGLLGMGLFGFAAIFVLALAPLLVAAGLFVGAAVFHACLALVGGLRQSSAGFEGSFRALAYSATGSLAQVIPLVGGLIALLWSAFLVVKGAVRFHRTSPGRVVAALCIPAVVLGVALIAAVMILVSVWERQLGAPGGRWI